MTNIINKTEALVKSLFAHETTGHDWWHIDRVRNNALYIAEKEGADVVICELAALLHDVADDKLNASKAEGQQKLMDIFAKIDLKEDAKIKILDIIDHMSFRGGQNPPLETLEAQVVQDADRLDAIGAIGIARAFTFAGARGNVMHDPDATYVQKSQEEYLKRQATAIEHFYDKLLKLKDLMNTKTAKELATERHQRMETFLKDFYEEWQPGRRTE
ncbi:HD domain-containing protein [Aureibacillus halotolerans]|uniref:HD/PDEase domain-containing protein n=1 Tax=Aureibacillus halotolerans TaxID=1508390 RepID=A0A4R6U172_9BACI|nr:uncharacterized protein EV213_110130 [Aureibacillus halotolerans]